MSLTFALAGNPNAGKTTLFNTLTGSFQYAGNWPGVTVEKKKARSESMRISGLSICRESILCPLTPWRKSFPENIS